MLSRGVVTMPGHCDLLPSETFGNHLVDDATLVIKHAGPWDLLIAHPPCTYLTNSGVRWLYKGGRQENGRDEQRWHDMALAARFFKTMLNAPIPRICVENPIMHGYARELIEADPTQIIQPWHFGHGETKATGLWLKNLPKLVPTNIVEGRAPRVHYASPGPDRWKERSRTMTGIAAAMADQWGSLDDIAEAAE
ncbi:hypothetical protein ACFQZO_37175 [Bradyrhizobium sp. GCM10027634]|uniref:hypothetical protein n=1 Tax=unclassified Bradyrhizobium TaxID=2631580 RepID=UPI00345FC70D